MFKKENFFVEFEPSKWGKFSYTADYESQSESLNIKIVQNNIIIYKNKISINNLLNDPMLNSENFDIFMFEDMGNLILDYVTSAIKSGE